MLDAERWTEHTLRLSPLKVGDTVRIQNQTGPYPTKWDKTGLIIEVRQFDQYMVRVDGSGRVTLRNRKFLRKYEPAMIAPNRRSILEDLKNIPIASHPNTTDSSKGHGPHKVVEDEKASTKDISHSEPTNTWRRAGTTTGTYTSHTHNST